VGYLDKTSLTVTANFTKRGREVLADCISGDGEVDLSYIITKFALGDDEIDYGLWDETQSSNLKGRIIDNMPMVESFINQKEIMNSFIVDPPPTGYGPTLSNLQDQIELTGVGDIIDILPTTDNYDDTEVYEFFLEHDNLFEMYVPWNAPTSDFSWSVNSDGSDINLPPISGFTWSIGF
jgi:hypothetical protein